MISLFIIILIIISSPQGGATSLSGELSHKSRISLNNSSSTEGNLQFTTKSEDSVLINPRASGNVIQLGEGSSYRYSDGGDSLSDYQPSSDIFDKKAIISANQSTTNSETSTFPKSVIYVDDPKVQGEISAFEKGDDIYEISNIRGETQILEEGIEYKPPSESIRYLSPNDSDDYEAEYAIIQSNDSNLGKADTIKGNGERDILFNLSDSGFQLWEDDDFLPGYDAKDGDYGEAIYQSGGDGSVDPGVDKRVTEITITTKRDQNSSTIDLALGNVTLVENGDQDVGLPLASFGSAPTINEIDPDNSSVKSFDQGDIIAIDPTGDGKFDSSEDFAINGKIENGTQYSDPNVEGEWHLGRTSKGSEFVVYDRVGSDVGLCFSNNGLEIDSKSYVELASGQLKYYSTDDRSTDYQKSTDGLYVDISDDDVTAGTNPDLRLSHFEATYARGTIVQDTDLDSRISVVNFSVEDKLLDLNENEKNRHRRADSEVK